jgi:hypothetical protein
MAEQNGSQQRPASSSNSYPSPQMQPAYTYPPQGGQNVESYRQSPTSSNMPLPPLSLPPLRAMEGPGQPQGQHPPAQVGIPMAGHPMQYYPGPPQAMAHPGQSMHNMATAQLMRYPIPAQGGGDARMLSGGRHKKEIKRRTKTGCLTCRKRRIKVSCDMLFKDFVLSLGILQHARMPRCCHFFIARVVFFWILKGRECSDVCAFSATSNILFAGIAPRASEIA